MEKASITKTESIDAMKNTQVFMVDYTSLPNKHEK
jgi:hypothetical protein